MRYIFGGKNYYSHFFPYLPRGEKWLYGKIYYIAIIPPIQVRGNGYRGGNGSITPALVLVINYCIPIFIIVYCFCSRTFV